MRKIYSIFIILVAIVLTSVLPASAQSARVTVSYRENFNDFSYTGQKDDGTTIHAIGGGTATVNVDQVSVPQNAKLDSILVRMSGVDRAEKLTAAGSKTFTIGDATAATTYSFTATVYYTQGENTENKQFTGSRSVTVYPKPVMPTANSSSSAVYERGASATISRSVTNASGGNSSSWQYNWTITTKDNGVTATPETRSGANLNYSLNSSFVSETKTLREVAFSVEVVNMAPVGNEQWVKTTLNDFEGVKVYNTPSRQPSKLGHFTDQETGQDFYVAMNLGVTDAAITASSYVFNFLNGSNVTKAYTRKLDNAQEHNTYNNVFVQWTYDDGYVVPVQAPSQVELAELSIDYKYTSITLEPHSSIANDDRYLKTPVSKDGDLHYFARSNATLAHEVKGVGFDIENGNVKTHLSNLVEGSRDLTADYTWRTLQPGVFDYYLEVKGKLRVESSIYATMDISGMYTSPNKIQIWEFPTPAQVNRQIKSGTDIESIEMNFDATEAGGGVPENWRYEWVRQNAEENSSVTLSTTIECSDNDPIDDNQEVKHIRKFDYALIYSNVAPDNETVWFSDVVDAGEKIVYNAPDAPQYLLYTDDSKLIAVANIGLSDEQLREREYKFFYPTEPQNNQIQNERTYEGNSKPEVVACLWQYGPSDGATQTFNALSAEAHKTVANLDETFEVETSTKDGEGQDIRGYLGAVRKGNNIYALTGSENRLKIQVSDNYRLANAAITINQNPAQDAEINVNSAVLSFCPQDEEIANYTFSANIDYAVILDRYTEDGQTKYVYPSGGANILSKQMTPADRLNVYPRPVIPEVKLDSVYLTDNNLKGQSYTIEGASGANASGWSYAWETGDAENEVEGMECSVSLQSLGAIDGPANEIKNIKVRAIYRNESPVQGQKWFEKYVDIADINIYNVPNRVRELVKYKDESNEYYIAQGLYCGDENLSRYEYKFRFFEGDNVIHESSERSWRTNDLENKPDKVCSFIVYPKDANHDPYEVATAPVTYAGKEVSPTFISSVSHMEDHRYDKYNFSYRQHPELGFYDLAGSQYNVYLRTEGDFYMSKGTLDNMLNAEGSPLSFVRAYNSEGEYLPKVSGELLYAAEPGISPADGKYTTLHFDYTYPKELTVHIYPEPVAPEEFQLDNVQFRDIDQLKPMNNDVAFHPTGANASGWDYSWIFDGVDMGHNMVAQAQAITSNDMSYEDHTFSYRWTNASPMPDDPNPYWMSKLQNRTVRVYNTPEKPGVFVAKGNGTSGIYIANHLTFNGSTIDDTMLEALKYQFQFGDNEPVESNAITTEQFGRRWYQYSSANRPWVRSVWVYGNEYTCYSDFVISEGSRAEFTVEDIFNYEGDDMQVYTISGAALGNVRMRDLTPGLYIVEIGTGDDKFIKKIYKK